MKRTVVAVALLALVVVAAFAVYAAYYLRGPCQPTRASEVKTSQLKGATFGGVTEYGLPTSSWANGITVAADGSVWFGEQALPGVGRFVPNTRTLTEYQWPCYPSSKTAGVVSSIWGITVWNGRVWAADGDANRLVGLDPQDGSVTYINTTSARFPYLLAPAPDGDLWFTSLSSPAKVGVLHPDLSVGVLGVPELGHKEPIQVKFVNSTYAYLVALNPYVSTDSGVYSFNPQGSSISQTGTIMVTRLGGNFKLYYPQSLSTDNGTVWVAQHFPSNLVGYDIRNGTWTVFPTPTLKYENTTLPYFVESTGERVWFNEHYANKIAFLNPVAGQLTEYSESDPPASSPNQIQNDLTIATSPDGLWFTSTSGDYIGFVDARSVPSFYISTAGSNLATVHAGSSLTIRFKVTGVWTGPLSVQVSDSESFTSFPRLISIMPDGPTIAAHPYAAVPVTMNVTLSAAAALQAGRYTVAVTVTDGLVYQTAYLFLTVT